MPPDKVRLRHLLIIEKKLKKSGRPLSLGKNASRGGVTVLCHSEESLFSCHSEECNDEESRRSFAHAQDDSKEEILRCAQDDK